jgi:Fe-Mn family superoxide dismutase
MDRRDFIALGALATATSVIGADNGSQILQRQLQSDIYTLRSLAFDPKKLNGLSEKIILSHHQNNYGGAIKRAKMIEEKMAVLSSSCAAFELGSLKREQMVAVNSMILHEYYFDNLGASGQISPNLAHKISATFSTVQNWENEFKKGALSLGGGSGWMLLVYNHRLKSVENVWSWDHMHGLWDSEILLALDMYEHSYQMDFGANAKEYIEVFMKNINWDIVTKRFESLARS